MSMRDVVRTIPEPRSGGGAWRNIATIGVVAVCHLVSTLGLTVYTFRNSMARFDVGASAGMMERGAEWALSILSFPLVTALLHRDGNNQGYLGGLEGYLPFALNSLFWAVGVLFIAWAYRRHREPGATRPR